MQSCIHTHTTFCDGKNTPAEMAAAAFAAGVEVLGFSGHSYVPAEGFGISPARLPAYRAACDEQKRRYAGRLQVLCGLEVDADAPPVERAAFDYLIGSLHSVAAPDGAHVVVDDTPEALAAGIQTHFGGDGMALVTAYYTQLADFLERLRPDVIGHFDLVRKFNGGGTFFDETSPAYRAAALTALERVLALDAVFEVNTGAMSRGWQKTPYPAAFLLQRLRQKNGRVVLTTDAHSAQTLLYGMDEARQLCSACGFAELWQLTAAGWQREPLCPGAVQGADAE